MKAKSFVPDDGMVRPPAEDLELLRTWALVGKVSLFFTLVNVSIDVTRWAMSYF